MFNICDIVRLKCGFDGDINAPETGRLCIIDEMDELFSDEDILNDEDGEFNEEDRYHYSVVDMETGYSSAWWHESYLEFVSKGSRKEILDCKRKILNKK